MKHLACTAASQFPNKIVFNLASSNRKKHCSRNILKELYCEQEIIESHSLCGAYRYRVVKGIHFADES
jgi:hypothetical protein